jgi:hypothetical protein
LQISAFAEALEPVPPERHLSSAVRRKLHLIKHPANVAYKEHVGGVPCLFDQGPVLLERFDDLAPKIGALDGDMLVPELPLSYTDSSN